MKINIFTKICLNWMRKQNGILKMKELSKIEKDIIFAYIKNFPARPFETSKTGLYNEINYDRYSKEDFEQAFSKLRKDEYFKEKNGSYELPRERFLEAKKCFKMKIYGNNIYHCLKVFWLFVWKHFLVTIITSVVVSWVVNKFMK